VLLLVKKIAESMGVEIYAEPDWEYTFFASPYPAHHEFRAMDIYQGKEFGDVAESPVAGTVYRTMSFDSPSTGKKSFPEYLTLIRCGDYLAKIMHVEPSVVEGDVVGVGDPVGRFIVNGYFTYWVDAGMHLEVRNLRDFVRARGGCELAPIIKEEAKAADVSVLEGVVVSASERNIAVLPDFQKVAVVGRSPAFLDGATLIGRCGVVGVFPVGETVYFHGIRIGKVSHVGAHMSAVKLDALSVSAGGVDFAGLSFMFGSRLVRLLPKAFGEPKLKVGDRITLDLVNADEGRRL
jgi:hypothetical protein